MPRGHLKKLKPDSLKKRAKAHKNHPAPEASLRQSSQNCTVQLPAWVEDKTLAAKCRLKSRQPIVENDVVTTCPAMKLMCTKLPGEPSLTKRRISRRRAAAARASQEAGSRQLAQASKSRSQPGRSHQHALGHRNVATKMLKGCPDSCFPRVQKPEP